ncbi:MAG TPA: hypothetical protein VF783_15140 [Terriglobales bacterium]
MFLLRPTPWVEPRPSLSRQASDYAYAAQLPLALQKRLRPQIPAVQPQKIEHVIARLAAAGHELVEVRAAVGVQYHTLTIQNGALSFQTAQGLLEQRIKLMEFLPLARHQLRLVAVDVQHAAKAVVLQLVDPVGMADRLLYRR